MVDVGNMPINSAKQSPTLNQRSDLTVAVDIVIWQSLLLYTHIYAPPRPAPPDPKLTSAIVTRVIHITAIVIFGARQRCRLSMLKTTCKSAQVVHTCKSETKRKGKGGDRCVLMSARAKTKY